eukprot:scaffold1336_cov36-Tisochrysis_lutea.AAC.1
MVPSLEPEASHLPHGEKSSALTVLLWWRKIARGFILLHCHTRTRRSHPPVATTRPSARTRTAAMPPLPLDSLVTGISRAVGSPSAMFAPAPACSTPSSHGVGASNGITHTLQSAEPVTAALPLGQTSMHSSGSL